MLINAEIDTLTEIQNLEKKDIPDLEVFIKEVSFGRANFKLNLHLLKG